MLLISGIWNHLLVYAQLLFFFGGGWFFATPLTAAFQAPLSIGFPRQEYWSGLSFSSPRDLPKPGIESAFLCLASLALAGRVFITEPPRKPPFTRLPYNIINESHETIWSENIGMNVSSHLDWAIYYNWTSEETNDIHFSASFKYACTHIHTHVNIEV